MAYQDEDRQIIGSLFKNIISGTRGVSVSLFSTPFDRSNGKAATPSPSQRERKTKEALIRSLSPTIADRKRDRMCPQPGAVYSRYGTGSTLISWMKASTMNSSPLVSGLRGGKM